VQYRHETEPIHGFSISGTEDRKKKVLDLDPLLIPDYIVTTKFCNEEKRTDLHRRMSKMVDKIPFIHKGLRNMFMVVEIMVASSSSISMYSIYPFETSSCEPSFGLSPDKWTKG
jgi:hypothetical protein